MHDLVRRHGPVRSVRLFEDQPSVGIEPHRVALVTSAGGIDRRHRQSQRRRPSRPSRDHVGGEPAGFRQVTVGERREEGAQEIRRVHVGTDPGSAVEPLGRHEVDPRADHHRGETVAFDQALGEDRRLPCRRRP